MATLAWSGVGEYLAKCISLLEDSALTLSMKVYLDNAATTPLDEAVFEEMKPYMLSHFGNPSSIHSHGRQVRVGIENARKRVAALLNASPSEIFFTSGGTEADNTALACSVSQHQIQHIITSPLEHHAVLHTVDHLRKRYGTAVTYLQPNTHGELDMNELESVMKSSEGRSLVSLMHGNNEIGTINDIQVIGDMCKEHNALFHSDTVQTMGHYKHDLQVLPVDYVVGSAHKFHGPKGVGFIYINHENKIHPLVHGGAQERNMRGGTENVYGIIGLAKAMEISYTGMTTHESHIRQLKAHAIELIKEKIPHATFNGASGNTEGLYTVLNIGLPASDANDMLLFNLDIQGISVSGGSACSSGSNVGSHVLEAIGFDAARGAVRMSFSRKNTVEEVTYAVEELASTVSGNSVL